jgi:predicted nucleotidyltransferase
MSTTLTRTEILDRLREHESELHRRGVVRVALFGSAARGEARSDSDIDLMVEIDPQARVGVFQYAGIVNYLQDMFPGRVDVADRKGLKQLIRPNVEREAVYAF